MPQAIETLVQQSVERFKLALGWKAQFIDAAEEEAYKAEIRRVIYEARRP